MTDRLILCITIGVGLTAMAVSVIALSLVFFPIGLFGGIY